MSPRSVCKKGIAIEDAFKPKEIDRLFNQEEKWSLLLDERGVDNIIDRLILADLFEIQETKSKEGAGNGL